MARPFQRHRARPRKHGPSRAQISHKARTKVDASFSGVIVTPDGSIQSGEVMAWTGLPHLLLIGFVPLLMKRFDPRLLAGGGLVVFAAS